MKKYECSMAKKKEALTHRKAIREAADYPAVKVGDTEWMSGYLDIDDGGPGIYGKDGMLYYTLPAALRVAKSLPGWRLPEGSDFDAIGNGDFRKIGLKDTGMADIEEKGGKYVPSWFGDETPYLMGTSSVFFRSFGSGATCRTGGHAAPVKLIKEAVPAHTYHTPLVKGEIWDFGNFNGSYWDEDHYKYGEMHRKVQKIVNDWTKKMKAEYPDVAEVVYARISEPWARQSCMLVDYVAPEAELEGLKKALEGTAVKLKDHRGPWEITDDIYGGPEVGYYTRETK